MELLDTVLFACVVKFLARMTDKMFNDMLARAEAEAISGAQDNGVDISKSGLSETDRKLYDPVAARNFVGPKQEPKFWLFVKHVCAARGSKCTPAWKEMMLDETCKGFYADREGSDTGRMVTQLYMAGLVKMRKAAENDTYNMLVVLRTKTVKIEYPAMFELESKLKGDESETKAPKEIVTKPATALTPRERVAAAQAIADQVAKTFTHVLYNTVAPLYDKHTPVALALDMVTKENITALYTQMQTGTDAQFPEDAKSPTTRIAHARMARIEHRPVCVLEYWRLLREFTPAQEAAEIARAQQEQEQHQHKGQ